jgi:hypothetical protein
MTQPPGRFDGGMKVPSVDDLMDLDGDPLGIVVTSALQAALIALATANSSAPTNGQAIIFQSSTGNLIWGPGDVSESLVGSAIVGSATVG